MDNSLAVHPGERNDPTPRVYLHLDHGRSPASWMAAYERGKVFEDRPYGYHWAEPWVVLDYAADSRESGLGRRVRRGAKFVLGFDLIHAFRNRHRADVNDVIWTHTEGEYLADAMLMKLKLMKRIPIVGQSVWLWDRWPNWGQLRRRFHRWLLSEVTVLTTHSALNATTGSDIMGRPVLLVPFGIQPTFTLAPGVPDSAGRIRVVAPGHDRHRDWKLLQRVARRHPDIEILVLSSRRSARKLVVREVPNFKVRAAVDVEDLIAAYRDADVVAVPLRHNMHVSGITVAMESLSAGRPLVITRTGGVEDYLGDAAHYAPIGDVCGLAEAIRSAAALSADSTLMSSRRERLKSSGLLIKDFGRRHVLLTRIALGRGSVEAETTVSRFAPINLDQGLGIADPRTKMRM